MLAFGGILFLFAAVILLVVVAWVVFGYLRGTAEAAEEGIDPEPDDRVEPLEKVD